MNDDSAKKTQKKKAKAAPKKSSKAKSQADTAAAMADNKQKRWSFIQNDLENALDTWDELEKKEAARSPEEEQLVKIKSIINQLKDKLDQF